MRSFAGLLKITGTLAFREMTEELNPWMSATWIEKVAKEKKKVIDTQLFKKLPYVVNGNKFDKKRQEIIVDEL